MTDPTDSAAPPMSENQAGGSNPAGPIPANPKLPFGEVAEHRVENQARDEKERVQENIAVAMGNPG